MSKLKTKSIIELSILSVIYLIFLAYCFVISFGTNLTFIDSDDFMRVVRLREFFQHYDLSNSIIARSNYPFGCDLHWTRLYDFFIIGLSWIIDLFVNSINKSIDYACFIISPILGVISLIFIYKIFDRILEKNNAFLASVLFSVSVYIVPFFLFGRADHHSFITLCLIIYVYCTIKMVFNESDKNLLSIFTAIAASACIWASPETLVALLTTDAVLFFVYMHDYEKLEHLLFKTLITTCIIGTISMFPLHNVVTHHCLTLCLLLLMIQYIAIKQNTLTTDSIFRSWHFVCLMMMLLFIPNIKPIEYDKISIVHTTLFMCMSVFFAVNLQFVNQRNQLKNAILWAIVIAIIFLSMFPRFFTGMSADIPPFIKNIWQNRIAEMQSPFKEGIFGSFSIYSILIAATVVVKIREIKNQKLTKQNISWLIFTALTVSYWILACFVYRMTPYFTLFNLPFIVNLGMSSKYAKKYPRILRIIATILIAYSFVFISSMVPSQIESDTKPLSSTYQYSEQELYSYLDNLSEGPVTILAHTNLGPKILYYTKHRVAGSPYHRQTQGIVYSHVITEQEMNLNLVKKVLKKTNAAYIYVNQEIKKLYPTSFSTSLIKGNLPKWISKVELPKKFDSNYLFKVNQKILRKEQ